MFKVGDKVKYTFDNGKAIYGVIKEIDDACDYKYYVHYNEDSYGTPISIYDWEREGAIELVDEGASVDNDDAKFRAFLEEVANGSYNCNYIEEYHMLEKIMKSFDKVGRKEAIDELCAFYKDFTPNNRKKMTLEEIEKELGYKIEVVE